MRRWAVRLVAVALIASVVILCAKGSDILTRAAEMLPRAYFPLVFKGEPVRIDDFEDQDPAWQATFFGGPAETEGSFFYRSGVFVGEIRDNSANNIAWPGWRPLADFKLEVDARFADPKWLNGLGLVFGGNDDWTEYYAFMLSYNFGQQNYAVARVEPRFFATASLEPDTLPRSAEMFYRIYLPIIRKPRVDLVYHWLLDTHSGWRGAPMGDVRGWKNWNHLMVVRVGDTIEVFVNGFQMPNGTFTDGAYGRNRLVGLLTTSHELNEGEVEFDNFTLTPLSMP